MAAAGCEGINFGIESAEVAIQENVGRKPITQEQIIDMVALCRKLRIKTFCFFIIGLPGDTTDTVLQTIRFAVRLRANWIQFNAASPLMGTQLRTWAISNGFTTDDEYSYRSSHEATMGNENLTKQQIEALLRFALLFERYLINRRGILKDETRHGIVYNSVQAAADIAAGICAKAIFAIGRPWFRRALIPHRTPV